jgi:hypothetical protein
MLASQAILDQFRRDRMGFFEPSCNYGWHLDPYIWSRDQRTIQGMETQWFPASKEVQDIEVIKQGVGVSLLGQRWNFACRLTVTWKTMNMVNVWLAMTMTIGPSSQNSPERQNRNCLWQKVESSYEPQMGLDTKTDWLTIGRNMILTLHASTLKTAAPCSSEISVSAYRTMLYQNSEISMLDIVLCLQCI